MTEPFDPMQTPQSSLRPPRGTGDPEPAAPRHDPAGEPIPRSRPPERTRRGPAIRIGAVVALAVAAGLVAWLVLRHNGSSSKPTSAQQAPASAVSVTGLTNLASSVGHPVFWLGPRTGDTYELTQTSSGRIYVRYLPPGVKVGTSKPYLTVATYPFPGALAALQKQAKARGSISVKLANGGLALLDSGYPESAHVAYPGVDYQVEVFDPTPSAAMQAVAAGHIAFFGNLRSGSAAPAAPAPKAISPAGLKALAASLGHPIYWAGRSPGYTYELSQTSTGSVYVRYLPAGVKVGSSQPYLTIATYPFPNAFAALERSAAGNKTGTVKLAGGGIAVVDLHYPKSIHLAFPNSNVQVEVFDPSPARTLQVVTSGKIAPVP